MPGVKKTQLDFSVLLPELPDARDDCVGRLTNHLLARDGVENAHVVEGEPTKEDGREEGVPARLCIHYDPDLLSMVRIRQMARQAGARLTDRYGHVLWTVEGLTPGPWPGI